MHITADARLADATSVDGSPVDATIVDATPVDASTRGFSDFTGTIEGGYFECLDSTSVYRVCQLHNDEVKLLDDVYDPYNVISFDATHVLIVGSSTPVKWIDPSSNDTSDPGSDTLALYLYDGTAMTPLDLSALSNISQYLYFYPLSDRWIILAYNADQSEVLPFSLQGTTITPITNNSSATLAVPASSVVYQDKLYFINDSGNPFQILVSDGTTIEFLATSGQPSGLGVADGNLYFNGAATVAANGQTYSTTRIFQFDGTNITEQPVFLGTWPASDQPAPANEFLQSQVNSPEIDGYFNNVVSEMTLGNNGGSLIGLATAFATSTTQSSLDWQGAPVVANDYISVGDADDSIFVLGSWLDLSIAFNTPGFYNYGYFVVRNGVVVSYIPAASANSGGLQGTSLIDQQLYFEDLDANGNRKLFVTSTTGPSALVDDFTPGQSDYVYSIDGALSSSHVLIEMNDQILPASVNGANIDLYEFDPATMTVQEIPPPPGTIYQGGDETFQVEGADYLTINDADNHYKLVKYAEDGATPTEVFNWNVGAYDLANLDVYLVVP